MADKRITELNLHTSLELSDVIPIVNSSETKKTTYGTLYYSIRDGVISGSSQITLGDTNGFSSFSSSLNDTFVPYIGATTDVNLGNNDFIAHGIKTEGAEDYPIIKLGDYDGVENGTRIIIDNPTSTILMSAQNGVTVNGDQTITGSLDVSGNSQFGTDISNTHEFTGSLLVSGSINTNIITGRTIFSTTDLADRAATVRINDNFEVNHNELLMNRKLTGDFTSYLRVEEDTGNFTFGRRATTPDSDVAALVISPSGSISVSRTDFDPWREGANVVQTGENSALVEIESIFDGETTLALAYNGYIGVDGRVYARNAGKVSAIAHGDKGKVYFRTSPSASAAGEVVSTVYTNMTVEEGLVQISGSLQVGNSLTASLQENYVWLGDSTNRSTPTPISDLPFTPAVTGSNADDLGGVAIRTLYTRTNAIIHNDTANTDFLSGSIEAFGSRNIPSSFLSNTNFKSKALHFRVFGAFTSNNTDCDIYLQIGNDTLTHSNIGATLSQPNGHPFEILGEVFFTNGNARVCYSIGHCDNSGDYKRYPLSDATQLQDVTSFAGGDFKVIIASTGDIRLTTYGGYLQVFN